METAIRAGVPADAPALAAIFDRSARSGWSSLFPPEWFEGLESAPRDISLGLAGLAGMRVLVAERSGRLAGFVLVRPSADEDAAPSTGELHMLFVDPGAWGAGVGRALLQAGAAELRGLGYGEATLWTAQALERAPKLYASAGWRLDGLKRTRTVRGRTFEEARYRLALGPRPTPSPP